MSFFFLERKNIQQHCTIVSGKEFLFLNLLISYVEAIFFISHYKKSKKEEVQYDISICSLNF